MFGWTAGEVLGKPLPVVPDEKTPSHRSLVRQALEGQLLHDVELLRRRKDGSLIDVSLFGNRLKDRQDNIANILLGFRDIVYKQAIAAFTLFKLNAAGACFQLYRESQAGYWDIILRSLRAVAEKLTSISEPSFRLRRSSTSCSSCPSSAWRTSERCSCLFISKTGSGLPNTSPAVQPNITSAAVPELWILPS